MEKVELSVEQTREELRREASYLAALHETALALMQRLETPDLLVTILRRAADLAGTPHGYVYLREPGDDEIEVKVGLGAFESYVGFRLRCGEGLGGTVWKTGEPLVVDDYDAWAGRSGRFDRGVFRAVAGVPLTSGSEVVGVIGVAHVQPGLRFGDDIVRQLTAFARLASVALDNARLYAEAQRELSERRRVEGELRRAEVRYRTLVERLPATVFIDAIGGVDAPAEYISPRIQELLGYTPEEWIADPSRWPRILHPDDRDRVLAAWERHMSTMEPMVEEYRMFARDGREVWVHDESEVARDEEGNPLFSQGFFIDITERKAAEAERERMLSLLRATLESTADGILVVDGDGRIMSHNRKFAQMWRIPDEVLGTGDDERALAFVLDQLVDRDGFLAKVRELYSSPDAESYDVLHFKDGRVFERYSMPQRIGDRPAGRVWSFRDVTDRWRAEEELRDSEQRFRALSGSTFEALSITADGEILEVNEAFLRMFGYAHEEVIGRSALEMTAPGSRDLVKANMEHGGEEPYEAVALRRDGTTFIAEIMGRPIEYRGRRARVTALRDVTQRREAEEALREALGREQEAADRLRTLDEMKNSFLAAVSHELRTPLSSVIGFASTLAQPGTDIGDEERAVMIDRVLHNARKLERLLSDLLDLDRLSRGIIEPVRRPIDLADLAGQVAEEADMAGRPLHVEATSVVAEVDGAQVERILENLLANAVKHTSPGTAVWLRIQPQDDGALITVEDAGPGVPLDERERVFHPFDRGSLTPSHLPGTGIGLSLVARFAELHGGRAWVEEREGGGSAFRVFLPSHAQTTA